MKKITFILMFLICSVWQFNAQVQIGAGTDELQSVPIEPYYGYTYSQSIYLASEIGTSGTITSIRWYYSGTTALPNSDAFTIYLGHTAKTEFANTADFVPLSGLTQVYVQTAFTTPPAVGWITLNLTTPFVYNGTSNLVVAADENKDGYDGLADDFHCNAVFGNRSVYYYSDGTNPDPVNPDAVGGFVSKAVVASVPNIIFGGITQACQTPAVLVSSAVTAITATIGWSETALSAVGYEYFISTSNNPPGVASVISGSSTTNPILMTGLSPNTQYFIAVRRLCSSTLKSAWSSMFSFNTLCLTSGLPYFQNFETATVPAIPNCTSILNAGSGNNWVTFDASVAGFNSKVLRYPWNGTNDANAWFFTQGINLVAGTSYNLLYKYGNDSTAWTEKLKVAYGLSASVVGMATQLADHPVINTATLQNGFVTFIAPTSGIYYFGFNAYSVANQNGLLVDDIKVEATPSCVPPTALIVTNITNNGGQIDWTEPAVPAALGYDFIVTTTNVFPAATATPTGSVGAGNNSGTFSGLLPNTLYYVWVRGKCTVSDIGPWSDSVSFLTNCANATTFTQNFDAATTFPACWKKLGAGGTGFISASGFTSTPNALFLNSSGTTVATQGLVVMPPVSNAGAGTYRLRFRARSSGAVGGNIQVGYLTDNFDAASFVTVQSFTTTSLTAFDSFSAELGTAPGTNKFLAFRHSGATTNGVLIDDVFWELLPNCFEPTLLTATNVTNNAASVTWTEPLVPAANGYEYFRSTTNVAPSAASIATGAVNAGISTFNFTGLLDNTTYYVWVRSVCNATDKSPWSSAVSFKTQCNPLASLPWTENFDALTAGTNVFPPCWGFENITNVWSISSGLSFSPGNSLRRTWNTDGYAFAPMMTLTQGTSYEFSYWMRTADTILGYEIITSVGNAQSASASTSTILNTTTNYQGIAWTKFAYNFSPTVTGSYSFAVKVSAPNPPNGINFDDFKVQLTPNCFNPTALVTSAVTNNTARVSWTPPTVAPASGYQYYLATTNTAPNAASTATASTAASITAVNLASLTPDTNHFIWVRSVCTASDSSEWSQAATFRTLCNPLNIPFVQDFESATVPALPVCSTLINAGTGNNWVTANTSTNGFSSKVLRYNNAFSAANSWFMTQGLTLVGGNSYDISYKYGNTSTTTIEKLKVAYGLSPTVASMTTQLADYPNITTGVAQNASFSFTPTVSGVYYFGFNAYSNAFQNALLVDDINIVATPNCRVVTALGSNTITSSSAVLSWTAPTFNVPANGYQYIVSASSTVPTAASVATGSTAPGVTSFSVTGLLPDTLQYVWVRSVCSATETGAWTGTAFRTLCSAVTTFSQNFDGTTFSCVYIINAGAGISILNNNAASASSCLLINSATATNRAVVSMPPVSNAGAGTHWLKFKARSRFTVGGVIEVGYLTNFSDANSFVSVQAFTTTSATIYDNFTAFLGSAPGANQVLAFRHTGVPANEVLIDDVSWEALPTCAEPTGLIASNVTSATATVSWTASASLPANGYQYIVSTTNTPPTAASVATGSTATGVVTVNLTAATPLVSNTQYFVWVRSVCSASSSSAWSATVSFRTSCAVYTTLNENFATFPPACFATATAGTVATGPTAGTGNLAWVVDGFLNNTALGATRANMYQSNFNAWLITPTMNLTSGNYVFSFKYGLTAYNATTVGIMGSDDSVKVLISTNGTSWTELTTFNAASNVTNLSNDYSYAVPPANATATVRFAVLASDGTVDDSNDIEFFVDDLKVEVVLSNNTFDSSSFSYYPNPVKDVLNLDYNQNITNVSVFNLLGQQVITKTVNANQSKIDMSNLNAGTYLVKVTADNQVKTIKVIKE